MNKFKMKNVQHCLKVKTVLLLAVLFLSLGCKEKSAKVSSSNVSDIEALNSAIKEAKPGDVIVMSNGVWKDVQIKFRGKGTKDNPITIKAETAGKVSIEGESYLKFGGEYLVAEGLHFQNGHSPSSSVVDFRINEDEIAFNCSLTNSVIEDFNQLHRDETDLWVQFWGRHNTLSNCYIAGKTNRGPTVRVNLEGIESTNNFHQIVNNHFGPRPRKGGASAETIQIGNSFTSMAPSYTMVANNLFEECNGEVEIISSKTNFNEFRNNVFYNSEGSLVTRHGNYCIIDGNYFINDSGNTNVGGIRIVNSGHWVTNNYFFNIKGESFRSALAVMNGIPKSPQNRYNQVTDVVVAYNTYVDCVSPWQFGVGTNISQKDVLPKSEIRSARAIRTTVANNVIYNEVGDASPVFEHDKADGVLFKSNVIDNQGVEFNNFDGGIVAASLELKKISDNILIPTGVPSDVEPYEGFDFNTITKDLFGQSREENNSVGAVLSADVPNPNILDKTKYGANWYSNEVQSKEAVTHSVASVDALQKQIDAAENGDVIALASGVYELDASLKINKTITINSPAEGKAEIVFSGAADTPVFELNPKGNLTLNNVVLKGNGENYAFATLKENMSNHFGLAVSNCDISGFAYALRVYREAYAETITFDKTAFDNCANGLELSEETLDKGDYNTEYLTITDCTFNAIKQNVVDYYRGGYDESTIGGNLLIANCTFTNSGGAEKNKTLLNHRGIVNVNIKDNTFKNNPVKFVSVLWGAKNNEHSNNTISNSGEIKVQENLEMTLMY
ncbi:chondroitinase-B domain-containing protein [Pseudotamlana agarivorans]|uniref:chondroitinase-B domain-containing protein n=1 Tax=Pseudotamlana agarivorans TaxID=481183 RepID=UPI001FDF8E48|nr:chondroitinase-B domain-containing protein [Tamlana agarivorans]